MNIKDFSKVCDDLRKLLGDALEKDAAPVQAKQAAAAGAVILCEFAMDIKRIADVLEKTHKLTAQVYKDQARG